LRVVNDVQIPQTGDLVWCPRRGDCPVAFVEAVLSTGQLLVKRIGGGPEMLKLELDDVDAWHRADWRRPPARTSLELPSGPAPEP
jgi:hypothetical protein